MFWQFNVYRSSSDHLIQYFLKALVGKAKSFWEIITMLPAIAVHLLVQKAPNFSCLYKLKTVGT